MTIVPYLLTHTQEMAARKTSGVGRGEVLASKTWYNRSTNPSRDFYAVSKQSGGHFQRRNKMLHPQYNNIKGQS